MIKCNPLVPRKQAAMDFTEDLVSDDFSFRVYYEYIKFLVLKHLHKDYDAELLTPSAAVDEVWHRHILNTKQYSRECMELYGQFMHHNPDGEVEPAKRDERYRRTLREYVQVFRTIPPPDIWEPLEDNEEEEKNGRENLADLVESLRRKNALKTISRNKIFCHYYNNHLIPKEQRVPWEYTDEYRKDVSRKLICCTSAFSSLLCNGNPRTVTLRFLEVQRQRSLTSQSGQ
jgi:hypothetical protein